MTERVTQAVRVTQLALRDMLRRRTNPCSNSGLATFYEPTNHTFVLRPIRTYCGVVFIQSLGHGAN
jgi:hypothetical protein